MNAEKTISVLTIGPIISLILRIFFQPHEIAITIIFDNNRAKMLKIK